MLVSFKTLGCPKNENDSEYAKGILEAAGYKITDNIVDSDIVIVNTCGFINDAKVESIEEILDCAYIKENAEKSITLVVSGCLSKRYANDLYKEIPEVDIFIGVNEYADLPKILEEYEREKNRIVKVCPCKNSFEELQYRKLPSNPYTANIKIAEGCNNACAYCVIPSIRGHYRSRKEEDILAEAEMLAEHGCKELIIIAQDVTAYGLDIYGKLSLPSLLTNLCKIEGIEWIRLMYCYEDKITDELIDVIVKNDKICRYIDIPLQHIDDKILKLMNRKSTNAGIVTTIEKLRKKIPDIHIRTTFIVGFAGERKAEFDRLYDFIKNAEFERLGVFAYSKEEGTKGANLKEQVRSDVKERRKDTIMRMQLEISRKINEAKIGKVFDVMVDGLDEEGAYIGRTKYDAPQIDNSVIFKANKRLKQGDIVKVMIKDAFDYDLVGEMI
ncbi:MAG: 30S ribosomal protein S12 methylthiotransferase RimO [Eubacteriales bacterium]